MQGINIRCQSSSDGCTFQLLYDLSRWKVQSLSDESIKMPLHILPPYFPNTQEISGLWMQLLPSSSWQSKLEYNPEEDQIYISIVPLLLIFMKQITQA